MIYVIGILAVLLLMGLLEYYHIEHTFLKIQDFKPKQQVPKELSGERIVYLSDFQFDHKWTGFRHLAIKRIVKKVNNLNPDLILFGGDLVHKKNRYNHHIKPYMSQFHAPIIAILGNHDYYDLETVEAIYQDANVSLIVNETLNYKGMQIVGVDDLRIGNPQVPPLQDQFTLLLTHSADVVETMKESYDIALAGHFHGGMVTVFGLYAPVIKSAYGKKYAQGMIKAPTGHIYVGRGLGGYVFFVPMRFFARPEIIVIDF